MVLEVNKVESDKVAVTLPKILQELGRSKQHTFKMSSRVWRDRTREHAMSNDHLVNSGHSDSDSAVNNIDIILSSSWDGEGDGDTQLVVDKLRPNTKYRIRLSMSEDTMRNVTKVMQAKKQEAEGTADQGEAQGDEVSEMLIKLGHLINGGLKAQPEKISDVWTRKYSPESVSREGMRLSHVWVMKLRSGGGKGGVGGSALTRMISRSSMVCKVKFSWVEPNSNGYLISCYVIQRRIGQGGAGERIEESEEDPWINIGTSKVTQFIDSFDGAEEETAGVTRSSSVKPKTFLYRVSAINKLGRSPWSEQVAITISRQTASETSKESKTSGGSKTSAGPGARVREGGETSVESYMNITAGTASLVTVGIDHRKLKKRKKAVKRH